MKRLFVRAGIALVGMTTWLLPNQAKAHILCSITVGGVTYTWSCPDDTQCAVTIYDHGGYYSLSLTCV